LLEELSGDGAKPRTIYTAGGWECPILTDWTSNPLAGRPLASRLLHDKLLAGRLLAGRLSASRLLAGRLSPVDT
jgi:hypothetical protein